MELGIGSYGLGFAAGIVSTLSPCVLPLIPILLASAVAAHRFGPLALSLGLMLSFTVLGVSLAAVGGSAGLDQTHLRSGGAVLLIAFGLVMLSVSLQQRFSAAASRLSDAGHGLLGRIPLNGLRGQFTLGLLLGAVWSPCVGPTLGGAIALASQGRDLAQSSLLMALFGLGAALPLAMLGMVSRQAFARARGRLVAAGRAGKYALGGVMLGLGVLILSGLDKRVEAWALTVAPDWLAQLVTGI